MVRPCDCRNVCGDDPALTKGDAEPCAVRAALDSDDDDAAPLLTMPLAVEGRIYDIPTPVAMHIVQLRMLLERATGTPIQWR